MFSAQAITVSAAIAKTGNVDSTLTLNANNNIIVNAPITSSNSALALNLNSNRQDDYNGDDHGVQLNANLALHGGVLTVSEGSAGAGNGTLNINAGTTSLDMATSAINAALVNVAPGATIMPYSKVVSLWFDRRRGLALGLAMAGVGLGGIILPSYATWLLTHFGWRAGFMGIGAAVLLIASPAIFLRIVEPAGFIRKASAAVGESGMEVWRQVRVDAKFWLIAIPGCALAVLIFAINLTGDGLHQYLTPEDKA